MKQLAWTLCGFSTAATAYLLFNRSYRTRRIPVTIAAERLQRVWDAHRTQI